MGLKGDQLSNEAAFQPPYLLNNLVKFQGSHPRKCLADMVFSKMTKCLHL